jgi:hypothetical protein
LPPSLFAGDEHERRRCECHFTAIEVRRTAPNSYFSFFLADKIAFQSNIVHAALASINELTLKLF